MGEHLVVKDNDMTIQPVVLSNERAYGCYGYLAPSPFLGILFAVVNLREW